MNKKIEKQGILKRMAVLPVRWRIASIIVIAVLVVSATVVIGIAYRQQPAKPAGPVESVTLAVAAIPHASLVHVALAKGFFADEGLKVNPRPYAFGKPAFTAVLQGQADLATVAETPVMFAIMDGKKISIAAVIETSNQNCAIIARKDLGILNPNDLKGKTIGVPLGSNAEFFLDSFLVAQGIARKDVVIADMTPDQIQEGLLAGKIAAAAIWNPTLVLSRVALGEKGLIFYAKEFYTENFCIAGAEGFMKNRPEAMKRVLKALMRAESYVKERPEEALGIAADAIRVDKAVLRTVWDGFRFRVSLDQSLIMVMEDESRWAIRNGLVQRQPMPNYLDCIYADPLFSVGSEKVRLFR